MKARLGLVFWLKGLALTLIGLVLVYQGQTATAAPPKQEPITPPSLVRGAALWSENCAPCHGITGRGDGPTAAALEFPPTNFADPMAARTRTLAEMFEVTRNGRMDRFMPPWQARLSEQEMWDVAAYAQSLSVSRADLEAGAAVYAESCAECHGEVGQAAEIDLSQPALLVDVSQETLFDTLRADTDVHASLANLPDEALAQSLAFVRTFSLELPALDGEVSGYVRNGTTGEVLANTAVTLYALSPNGEIMQTYQTTSADDGRFLFTDLDSAHTMSYALEGVYQGVTYTSPEPVIFLPDLPEAEQDLMVYETTDDPAVLSQRRLHRIMTFGPGQIRMADVYVFGVTGDQAFVGQPAADGQPATVKIGLPVEATNVASLDESIRFEDGYYLSSRPIVPGEETLISVQYDIPVEGADYRLETPLFYDVPAVNILAADQGQEIRGEQLVLEGVEQFQGTAYQLLSGTSLTADEPFVMELSGLDEITMPASGSAARLLRRGDSRSRGIFRPTGTSKACAKCSARSESAAMTRKSGKASTD